MKIVTYKGNIYKNHGIDGDNVYFDNGYGCKTIWFTTVPEARKFLQKHGHLTGKDSGLCDVCCKLKKSE